MRRQRWIFWTCGVAVVCLAVALQGVWASVDADDGTRWDVSVRKVSHVYRPHVRTSAHEDCDFLRGRGAVRHCAPADGADVAYSMLCAVFPLLLTAVALALGCATLTAFSPRPPGNSAAALTGAALAASFGAPRRRHPIIRSVHTLRSTHPKGSVSPVGIANMGTCAGSLFRSCIIAAYQLPDALPSSGFHRLQRYYDASVFWLPGLRRH